MSTYVVLNYVTAPSLSVHIEICPCLSTARSSCRISRVRSLFALQPALDDRCLTPIRCTCACLGFLYSRDDTPTRKRLETLIGKLEHGHAVTYASGLAAIYAGLRFLSPKRILKDKCYHGTKCVGRKRLLGSRSNHRFACAQSNRRPVFRAPWRSQSAADH